MKKKVYQKKKLRKNLSQKKNFSNSKNKPFWIFRIWEFFFGTPFFSEFYKKRTFLKMFSYYISKRGAFFIKFIFRNSHLFWFLEFENFGHLFSHFFFGMRKLLVWLTSKKFQFEFSDEYFFFVARENFSCDSLVFVSFFFFRVHLFGYTGLCLK